MSHSDSLRDRNVMLTGNVVFDAALDARVSAFALGGGRIQAITSASTSRTVARAIRRRMVS
jgi:hypothetical protein